MRSEELVKKIRDILVSSPDYLSQIPVDDVVSCVYLELYGLRQLYSSDRYALLEREVFDYSSQMESAKARGDCKAVLELLDKLIGITSFLPDSNVAQDFIERANFDRAFIRHRESATAVVLGDSHVNYFSGNEELSFIPIGYEVNTCEQVNDLPLTVLHAGPCLAYKSNQYGSSNRFREKVDWLLETLITEGSTIICTLGEIDLRAHVFKETERQQKSYQEIIDVILRHYAEFLDFLSESGYVVVCYGPIASQKDSCPVTEDHPRVGTEFQRNSATKYYNDELKKICEAKGYGFFTMFYDMVDENLETREEFLSEDKFHLGQYSEGLLREKLKGVMPV